MSIKENDPSLKSFIDVKSNSDFPIQNLPFGIFTNAEKTTPRLGVAIGEMILDLAEIAQAGLFNTPALKNNSDVFLQASLNNFIALGRTAWREARSTISKLLRADETTLRDNQSLRAKALIPMKDARLLLPVKVSGYTDFYSSKEHATNVGAMFRSKENALFPNWLHIPIGYDGRASSIVVSGTALRRPLGQIKPDENSGPIFAASRSLDTEVELAFIVGVPNQFGEPIPVNKAHEHVFGTVLLSDWSARDIQKWEYVPLGPFLAKNFCTSISPWVVTLDALEPFRVNSCAQDPEPLDYLKSSRDWSYDLNLELSLKTEKSETPHPISLTNFKYMYWDFCQQLAHHTVGGCNMMTGDIFASGTISGPTRDSLGCLLEITQGGKDPVKLANGEERRFLMDGDTAIIKGWCQNQHYRIGYGEVSGKILPALG